MKEFSDSIEAGKPGTDGLLYNLYLVNDDILRIKISVASDKIPERDFSVFSAELSTKELSNEQFHIAEREFHNTYDLEFASEKDDLGQRSWQLKRSIQKLESFYGLGDKPLTLDLRGRKLTNWGTDTYAYPYGADPLYKNIPFFFSIDRDHCHGIFINNTYKINFDFGSSGDELTISAPGGLLDLYIIPGASPIEIISKYTQLTGLPEMPPLWALGYHQSKWSYVPEAVISDIAIKFRNLNIPCDCLYLDIDYMDGYRIFTWDKEKFPNPAHLVNSLGQIGFRTVVIIDPGIKIDADYLIYVQGMEEDYFVKDATGENYIGPVWPGYCHFPDFTSKNVMKWWADHVTQLYESGIDGVWNDMNEPALFNKDDMIQTQRTFDDNVLMDFDGQPGLFSEGHNIYGMRMSEATMYGAQQVKDKRPFVLTRSTYAGGQKFAAVWTGDNVASWEHLKLANYQCQMLSISGISFTGSDIGGFVGDPDGELYTRWLQMAIFHPFFRTHSSKDFGDQEPWSYGEEWTNIARSLIEWRYKLLGYIYNTFHQYASEGIPMLRPVSLIHWKEDKYKREFEFFYFGDALLIAPVTETKQSGSWINLPAGDYYDLNNMALVEGGQFVFLKTPVSNVPALLKAGFVLPVWPVMQYVGQRPLETIELWLGFSTESSITSSIYLDEHDGLNYKVGLYKKIVFEYNYERNLIRINIRSQGDYQTTITNFVFKLIGIEESIQKITYNGEDLSFGLREGGITFGVRELNDLDLILVTTNPEVV